MLAESDFQRAMATLIKHEGAGFNADDPGGGSKYGVLQATYAEWLRKNGRPFKNIQEITLPEATAIYRSDYWTASGAPSLPSYELASLHFDTAVNMGVGTAKQLLAKSGNTVAGYIAARQEKYRAIAQANPAKAKYLNTWLKRAASFATSTTGKAIGGTALITLLVLGVLALRGRG
jgi:lysozyme family protein